MQTKRRPDARAASGDLEPFSSSPKLLPTPQFLPPGCPLCSCVFRCFLSPGIIFRAPVTAETDPTRENQGDALGLPQGCAPRGVHLASCFVPKLKTYKLTKGGGRTGVLRLWLANRQSRKCLGHHGNGNLRTHRVHRVGRT